MIYPICLIIIVGYFLFVINKSFSPKLIYGLVRYPFVTRWLHIIVPSILKIFKIEYIEATYRIIPFIFTVLFAWLSAIHLVSKVKWIGIILGFTIGTIPIVFFY